MTWRLLIVSALLLSTCTSPLYLPAQTAGIPGDLDQDLRQFVTTYAIAGYETDLLKILQLKLAALHPVRDNLGNILVTLGTGSPRRLVVAPVDEPGFVVSDITSDGYLRVQRLPQFGLPAVFNDLYSAQPVKVRTANGQWIDGVVAGLSVHLAPGRANPPKSSDLDNMYIDIGAPTAIEARRAGVDNLSPLVINRQVGSLAYGKLAGASIGDRFGAAAVIELLRHLDSRKVKGTLTVAFVVQQWTGARGLERILSTNHFDEMIYVGRLLGGAVVPGLETGVRAPQRDPGSGVLLGLSRSQEPLPDFAAELRQLAEGSQIPLEVDYSADLLPHSYLPSPAMPPKWAHLGIAVAWPATPAELIDAKDLASLTDLLVRYAGGLGVARAPRAGARSPQPAAPLSTAPSNQQVLSRLVAAYGSSHHEEPVRATVESLLPRWAKPAVDSSGNLILPVGTAPPGAKAAKILIIAHLDEIGIDVQSVSNDGRLEADWSGGEIRFYAGHPSLVHTAQGDRDAIYELPSGWQEPTFEWPRGGAQDRIPIRIDVGARSPEEVEKLGIKVGDSITIPKTYRTLLGTRANGRSFDDRVGCTALISAAWALGGPLKDRDVSFVFSTGEELGLVGAAALAKQLEAREPDYVFAVDTFVSSDSPLESRRFADAPLGKGFVVRAVDNSNIVASDLVVRVVRLAQANQIPVQYGVTGGGNDGSAFTRYGSVDVALGWPLRYSHSPAEVIDTRDVDALARIVAAIARRW
jgi:putative aminopeptidase